MALDPITNEQVITLKAGTTGGWRWVTSGGLDTPITVYGYALTDSTGATLLAAQKLPNPTTVQADGYQIELDPIQMNLVLAPIS